MSTAPLPPLDVADFGETYEAVHGVKPFQWQKDLVAHLLETRRWPGLIDLPTGAGKTSVIDCALFALALDVEPREGSPPITTWASRRIVLVVDRRVVVDQAMDHAEHIVRKLRVAGGESAPGRVATRLRALWGGGPTDPPFRTAALRGGIVRDESWAARPDVPAVLTSTVDQIGSRLLFRGYGISPKMRPIHAGLLGTDTTILLDEVHLSQPFADTLRAMQRYQGWAEQELPERWHVVEMSATPGSVTRDRFPSTPLRPETLQPDPDNNDAVLRVRLEATKLATCADPVKVPADPAKGRRAFGRACADQAVKLLDAEHVNTVAVVVNRVDMARWVARQLDEAGVRTTLLTGRMRPYDRDQKVEPLTRRLKTRRPAGAGSEVSALTSPPDDGVPRRSGEAPLAIVATQSIEVGVDIDVDALVTECASIDALRQRYGRLDRGGTLAAWQAPAPSRILVSSTSLKGDDPVYGAALRETWAWLQEQGPVDFGIVAFNRMAASGDVPIERLTAPKPRAPLLFPAHLDAWAQTRPFPPDAQQDLRVEPVVARWLHGAANETADVQLLWRADLPVEMLTLADGLRLDDGGGATGENGDAVSARDWIRTLLVACPPANGEAMPVPLAAARAWLQRRPAEVADVEGADLDGDETNPSDLGRRRRPRLAVRWRHDRIVVGPEDVRPGDVLVVPASYGGIGDHGNWDPEAEGPVPDVAHEIQWRDRRRPVLRLAPELFPGVRLPDPKTRGDEATATDHVRDWLEEVDVDQLAGSFVRAHRSGGQDDVDDPDAASARRQLQAVLDWLRDELKQGRRGCAAVIELPAIGGAEGDRRNGEPQNVEPRQGGYVGRYVLFPRRSQCTFSLPTEQDETAPSPAAPQPATVAVEEPIGNEADEPDDEDSASFTGVDVTLAEHLRGSSSPRRFREGLRGVEGWAQHFAAACGLDPELAEDLARAGRLHDLGKADERFQVRLFDGDEITAALAPEKLAKSVVTSAERPRRRAVSAQSRYPRGMRHELLSLAMVERSKSLRDAHDPDLVLHLIASHHGWCRPLPPAVVDPRPRSVKFELDGVIYEADTNHGLERFDSGIVDRFWRLVRRYGWWRLAWLEALLRLGDHHESQEEQRLLSTGGAS